jgi:hypothetical protein
LESNFYQIFHWSSIGEEETGKDRILVPYGGETDFFRQVLTFHIFTFTGQNLKIGRKYYDVGVTKNRKNHQTHVGTR